MKQDPVDILWQRARAAPTPQADLQQTWRRIEAQPAQAPRWPLGAAIAVGIAFAVVAMQPSPLPVGSPPPHELREGTPRFSAERWARAPAAPARALPTPSQVPKSAQSPSTPRPEPAPVLSAGSKVPPPPSKALRPQAPKEPSTQPPRRVLAYQPRAIVEFRRIDWERWQAQALPTAVAQMVQLRDSRGLLALLDSMSLRRQDSPLLMLRGQLRAQARRCAEAQADMQMLSDAGPPDLRLLCSP